jgi:ABC-type cobalamin/Fe3+-siderophores transport system ATPase subunit
VEMNKAIEIRNLKNISRLHFEIPGPGVHLLAGSNGAGKTTLLACLRRIGTPNAFQLHFSPSKRSYSLDDFSNSEIIYMLDDDSVIYTYAGERWVPHPRRFSGLVKQFGYPEVWYAGATASRITPRLEDFRLRRLKYAPLALREAANRIFATDRYTKLLTINLTRGSSNPAFVLCMGDPSRGEGPYASEKNLSLGELSVLKLLRELHTCHNGALVLIDELELALYPRVQIGLFQHLEKVAAEKSLTIIVSSHSVTLLKCCQRNRIIFLENRDDQTAVLRGCFPAYALGGISLAEEQTSDIVIYVEDEAAKTVAEYLVRLCINVRYRDQGGVFPTVSVLPVGDFKNVVRFYDKNRAILPPRIKQWILLDKDVESESVSIMDASSDNPMRDMFHRHTAAIRYLPWTPEVGLAKHIESRRQTIETQIRKDFMNAFIKLPATITTISTAAAGPAQRNECKNIIKKVVDHIHSQVTGKYEEEISKHLFENFAESYFNDNMNEAMQLFGPMIG